MKKLFKTFVALAAVAALGFSFVSCKNNDDDSSNNYGAATGNNGSGKSQSGKGGYIGTKAPSEAKAVGDIVFNDGSATPYTNVSWLSYDSKMAAVAVIFYAGSSDDVLGAKTLGVGLKQSWEIAGAFAGDKTTGFTTNFTEIQCTPSASGNGAARTATFTGDLDGSDNWAKICATDTTAEENAETNYPAFYKVNNYGTTYNVRGDDYQSGWYLPTVAELSMLYRVKDTVNAVMLGVLKGDASNLHGTYTSSSQCSSDDEQVWQVDFSNGNISPLIKNSYNYCRAIRAF